MNCKNCRVRSEKYKKFLYCAARKEKISFDDCKHCPYCEYKEQKRLKVTPIKRTNTKKSKRAKATDISQDVKEFVWNRDNRQCICCHTDVPKTCANAHYIKRSKGGLGIPENIVTLCPECHHEEDNGKNTKVYENLVKLYLQNYYGNSWNEKNLIYKKYKEEI